MRKRFRFSMSIFAAVLALALLAPPMVGDAAAHQSSQQRAHSYGAKSVFHQRHDNRYGKHNRRPRKHVVHYRPARHHRTSINIFVGRPFGTPFGVTDRYYVHQALETAPSGQAVVWNNPTTGTQYSVVPTRTWQTPNATYCREFTTTGVIGGREQQLYGTACRQPDGSWETAQ